MESKFAIADVLPGKLNALVKNVMKQTGQSDPNEAVRLVNSGEWILLKSTCRWTTDKDGLIHLPPLVGLGLTNPNERIEILESNGHKLSKWTKDVLNSPNFTSCEKGKEYFPVIMPGKLFSDEERTTQNIRAKGDRNDLIHGKDLPTELGILIRLNYTNEEIKQMGLSWLVTMHEPVKDSGGAPRLLYTRRGDGGSWLVARWDGPGHQWHREGGFVFGASQVSPQN